MAAKGTQVFCQWCGKDTTGAERTFYGNVLCSDDGLGVVATIIYCAVVSWVILKLIDTTVGLRVGDDAESEGLDIASHDERGYILQ